MAESVTAADPSCLPFKGSLGGRARVSSTAEPTEGCVCMQPSGGAHSPSPGTWSTRVVLRKWHSMDGGGGSGAEVQGEDAAG